jgi:hypothetical protein
MSILSATGPLAEAGAVAEAEEPLSSSNPPPPQAVRSRALVRATEKVVVRVVRVTGNSFVVRVISGAGVGMQTQQASRVWRGAPPDVQLGGEEGA